MSFGSSVHLSPSESQGGYPYSSTKTFPHAPVLYIAGGLVHEFNHFLQLLAQVAFSVGILSVPNQIGAVPHPLFVLDDILRVLGQSVLLQGAVWGFPGASKLETRGGVHKVTDLRPRYRSF